jgi:lysophospholipase L1-like esterase
MRLINSKFNLLLVLGLLALVETNDRCGAAIAQPVPPSQPGQFEREIKAFEALDRVRPPATNSLLFIGSSSIRLWKTLAEDMKGLPVINRGFGGSQMSDVTYFADRIVLPYRPREVIVYAGDNDLAAGKTPEQVRNDYAAFVTKVLGALPKTRITYISIKPSPSRWQLAEKIRAANSLISQFTASDERLDFIDVFTPLLGNDGKPRPELFVADKLHLNEIGYQVWATIIRARLNERAPAPEPRRTTP